MLDRDVPLPGAPSTVVDRPPSGSGEQPCAPVALRTPEAPQAADHAGPGLGRHVLGVAARDHPQVAQQGWVAVPPEPRIRALVPLLRSSQDPSEVCADHAAEYSRCEAALASTERTIRAKRTSGPNRISRGRVSRVTRVTSGGVSRLAMNGAIDAPMLAPVAGSSPQR